VAETDPRATTRALDLETLDPEPPIEVHGSDGEDSDSDWLSDDDVGPANRASPSRPTRAPATHHIETTNWGLGEVAHALRRVRAKYSEVSWPSLDEKLTLIYI
jgi:hypothetical protein